MMPQISIKKYDEDYQVDFFIPDQEYGGRRFAGVGGRLFRVSFYYSTGKERMCNFYTNHNTAIPKGIPAIYYDHECRMTQSIYNSYKGPDK